MKKIKKLLSLQLISSILIILFIVFTIKYNVDALILLSIEIIIFISILYVIYKIFKMLKFQFFLTSSVFFIIIIIIVFIKMIGIQSDYKVTETFSDTEEVLGFLSGYPAQKGNKENFQLKVFGIKHRGHKDFIKVRNFLILVKVKDYTNNSLIRGDLLSIKGTLQIPREKILDFYYKDFLFYQKIFGIISVECENINIVNHNKDLPVNLQYRIFHDNLYKFRNELFDRLKSSYSDLIYGFIISAFFGDRDSLSGDVYQDFKDSGMLHLLAISGMNISFIGSIILIILRLFLSKSKALIFSILLVFLYVELIVPSGSSNRAFIMYLIQCICFISGFRSFGLTILSLTCNIMIIDNPYNIFDLGFQLSFFATAGIILFSKIIEEYFPDKVPDKLKTLISTTISAFLSVFFLQWALFQKIQIFSLITSIFTIPLFEILFISVFIMLIIWYITGLSFFIQIISLAITFFLNIINLLTNCKPLEAGEIPDAVSYLSLPVLVLLFYEILPKIKKISQIKKIKYYLLTLKKKLLKIKLLRRRLYVKKNDYKFTDNV